MTSRLREGATVTLKADPEPGRPYEVVGRALKGGTWWAYPVDGLPVPEALKHPNATGNAVIVSKANSVLFKASVLDAPEYEIESLVPSEMIH